ncbi:Protein SIEVE ELEMENT OCCLUSION C [Bienertia sinuspersici]
MALNYTCNRSFSMESSSSSELDILIKRILIMHDPDERELDSEMLLRVIENIMHHATASQVSAQLQNPLDMSSIEESQDLIENSIYKISIEILCQCYGDENVHESILSVFNLLGSYRWDAKLVLVLSAFASVFGEFWVIMQLQSHNPLAASIALLKQIPSSFSTFEPIFIALAQLVKTMVEVARSISLFEGLPLAHLELSDGTVTTSKSLIYVAAYWIVRSIIVNIHLITNLRDIKYEQVHLLSFQDPYSISSVLWEIASLKSKINDIGTQLRIQVDACQQQTEQKMHRKLINAFQEPHIDNQKILWMLFGLRNDLALKQSSQQAKVGISSLKNRVVILLISKPELLPADELHFLVQQTYDHPQQNNLNRSYEILWVPISTYKKWSNNEVTLFNLLSNSLPWYSIRQPWSLCSTTINYVKKEWGFDEKPIMVVMDPTGMVTNIKAADMVWIWGAEAYPFSALREEELWKQEKWNMRLLLDSIDPLLTMWVEERRTICIYGSNKLEWIREFTAEIKNIQSLAAQLEVVYIGKKDQSVLTSYIVSAIEKENLSHSLTLTKISLFWWRLESIRRSKLNCKQTTDTDHILREVETLLDTSKDEQDEDWIVFGRGSSTNIITLHGSDWAKFLSKYSLWAKYLPEIGLVDAVRLSLEPPLTEPCSHSQTTGFNQVLMEETVICEKCKRPMEKFIMYDVVD